MKNNSDHLVSPCGDVSEPGQLNGSVHTPGPWYVEGPDHEDSEGRTTGKWAIRAPGQPPSRCISYQLATLSGWDLVHDEANAKLIAAAPDLLEAVAAFLHYDGQDPVDSVQMMLDYADARDKAIAAYAKATGAA